MSGRHLRYLRAIGIEVWRPRSGGEPAASPGVTEATGAAEGPRTVDFARLTDLARYVAACRRCGLCETRTQTVFGVGPDRAECMIVGEAPGADEDRLGEPFVGRAGQLLNAMLAAIGLARDAVYIANILKCRPPGNRDPRPDEVERCEPFLLRQVELVGPRVILASGRIAAQSLLRTAAPIGRLRGGRHAFRDTGIPVVVTYHPAYLLRSPGQKRRAWEDLKMLRSILDGSP
jgi:DNA polymerase